MGHLMFFLAAIAACLLWSAAFIAAAARTERAWLRQRRWKSARLRRPSPTATSWPTSRRTMPYRKPLAWISATTRSPWRSSSTACTVVRPWERLLPARMKAEKSCSPSRSSRAAAIRPSSSRL